MHCNLKIAGQHSVGVATHSAVLSALLVVLSTMQLPVALVENPPSNPEINA